LERTKSGNLVKGTEASRAQVEALLLTVYGNSSRMDIGCPASISMSFGMTDVMTK